MKHTVQALCRDWRLWLALAAGPAFWGLLYAVVHPVLRPGWPLARPVDFLSVSLLYPVLEEMIFRGLLQEWLAERFGSRAWHGLSLANTVTSLVFASLHFIYHPPLFAASVFFPSLVFGYFRERHHGLAAPMLLHVWYNAGYFWIFG